MVKSYTTFYHFNCLFTYSINRRSLNTYAVGFLSVLDLLISETIPELPWSDVRVQPSRMEYICPPGTSYLALARSSYCFDNDGIARSAVQCLPCPFNHYSASADQTKCLPCENGTIANPNSTWCMSCYDPTVSNTEICATYIESERHHKTQKILSIVLPIVAVILLILAGWLLFYCCRRYRQRNHGLDHGDETSWLLSYNSLTRPSLRCSLDNSSQQDDTQLLLPTAGNPSLDHSPSSTPLLPPSPSVNDNSTIFDRSIISDKDTYNNDTGKQSPTSIHQHYKEKLEDQGNKSRQVDTTDAHWAMGNGMYFNSSSTNIHSR